MVQVVKILSAAEPSVSGVNSTDEEGWAPLHSAASSGSVEIVEMLLSRGDDRASLTLYPCIKSLMHFCGVLFCLVSYRK